MASKRQIECQMFNVFKVCMNCRSSEGSLRRRACRKCGASPALFRAPTEAEIAARAALQEANEKLLRELLEG